MREKKVPFLNILINNLTMEEAIESVRRHLSEKRKMFVVYANSDVIVKAEKDAKLRTAINSADLVLADGMPLVWISRFYKRPLKERIAGSDMVPGICEMAWKEGYSLFLLGGQRGVPEAAADNLTRLFPGITIKGVYSPPMGFEKDQKEVELIRKKVSDSGAEILIVCFGCPKQENFIYENREYYGALVSVCAGATIDFLAGRIRRCPKWMAKAGLEWFYRFLKEPKRLFKRYFIDDMYIFYIALKYRFNSKENNIDAL